MASHVCMSFHNFSHQEFTKSTDWFDDSQGWKSQQGGFSAVQQITTDENNMGGFFIRKAAGAVVAGVQLQKMIPLLFHVKGARFDMGHFQPLLLVSAMANIASILFFGWKWEELSSGNATELPLCWISVMTMETVVLAIYALSTKVKKGPAIAMKDGKTPLSVPSGIVSRTIGIVTTATALFAARDLFLPGTIMDFVPLDDIYLEWTNALRHSPPDNSPEALDNGIEAPLFVGDKFISQYMAFNLLLLCSFKLFSAAAVRVGADGRGEVQSKMFWTAQFLSNGMFLFLIRLFANAASSASVDFRWHLMALAYETFILGMYAFF